MLAVTRSNEMPAEHAPLSPVVVAGIVPESAIKLEILQKLRELYGPERVIDQLQVEPIPAPPHWGQYVAAMIGPGLKQVMAGKLEVNGQTVKISGQVLSQAQGQRIASDLSLASNSGYTVSNTLQVQSSAQQLLDQTLASRTIEFQSGSAALTTAGSSILDEMAAQMALLESASFLIIGHTDNVGQRVSNLQLSQERALAVKTYLQNKGIAAARMQVQGMGPDQPLADNQTADGRARNRRIEFKIL